MTTTASAHNITADLRTSLEGQLYDLRALAAFVAKSTRHVNLRVLYADCGMVVVESGGVFRLGSVARTLAAREFFAADAQAVADRWNEKLTREQMTSRCWVNVLTIPDAIARAIEEKEALLDVLAKPAA